MSKGKGGFKLRVDLVKVVALISCVLKQVAIGENSPLRNICLVAKLPGKAFIIILINGVRMIPGSRYESLY